jgi:hypothetical protein
MATIDHIRHLAETIGPRGSTTATEREGAEYAARSLEGAGLDPTIEPFTSATSAWYPSLAFATLMLVSCLLFWSTGRWGAVGALAVSTVALVSILLELAFRPNPLRWLLPKGGSQNVVARIPAAGDTERRVVLIGHLDSHRTPLAFSSDGWLKLFDLLVPIGLGASVVLILVFLASSVFGATFLKPLSVPFALAMLGLLLITAQADRTPYAAGANDNASGAAVVLSLAERLAARPLQRTEVWALLSGCEEVGCYGADAFARSRRAELADAVWLTLDTVGSRGADLCFLERERFLLTTHSDPTLLEMAASVASRRSDLGVRAHHEFTGAYTEGAIGGRYGLRVLTLIALNRSGRPTEWHRPTDLVDHVDPGLVETCEAFTWELVQDLDRAR